MNNDDIDTLLLAKVFVDTLLKLTRLVNVDKDNFQTISISRDATPNNKNTRYYIYVNNHTYYGATLLLAMRSAISREMIL